jgi:hypothetical protein
MLKTMSGQRYIRRCRGDGFTSTPVRSHGTILGYMPKDGARRCHTASHSLQMERQTLLAAMFERLSMPIIEIDVQKRSCYIS